MSDKGRQEKTKNETKILTGTQRTYIEKEIRAHAEGLAPDMNLRLFCEMPLSDENPMLWVESICVTDITYPQMVPQAERSTDAAAGFFRSLFRKTSACEQEHTEQKDGQKPAARFKLFRRWLGHDKR